MGWWDYGIMGGDTPLDIQGEFYDTFGYTQYDEEPMWTLGKPSGAAIEEFVTKMRDDWSKESWREEDNLLPSQCVTYIVLEDGLPLDPNLRTTVLLDISAEIKMIREGNSRFDNPDARRAALDAFAQAVQNYTGESGSAPASPGLFDVIFKE